MSQLILLDTDIGTDVDDCLALALALASPELELLGITTVYGDVWLRRRMVRKLLALHGGPDVPVAAGATGPLLGKRPVYWAGHEGQGLLGPEEAILEPDGGNAVELIVHTVMARPGEVTLVAIGPLTNVALALRAEPRLAGALAGLVLMGGVVGARSGQPGALALPWVEHNFRCDPEAAHVVVSSGAPLTIVPLDVTTRVRVRREDLSRLQATGNPFHLAVVDQVERYPRFAGRGWTHLHDPLAVAALIDPGLVTFERLHAVVETEGEHTAGMLLVQEASEEALPTARVALDVDVARSEAFIAERLARPLPSGGAS